MNYQNISVPTQGEKITYDNGKFNIPNQPIIPLIVGDGIGIDISPVMCDVVDHVVTKAYKGERKIHWMEIYAGDKAVQKYGDNIYLPDETIAAIKEFKIAIKGPLTTPIGGGIRSLNVALRQKLDLYTCLRPIRYFNEVPSPVKEPQKTNMVIFRENSEDIYAGIEWQADSANATKVIDFLQQEMAVKNIRFPQHCGIGVKPVSKEGTQRLVRNAIQYAIDNNLPSVTLVHKGNIMKFTEGAFAQWGYELAQQEFNAQPYEGGPWCSLRNPNNNQEIIIKDIIADAFLQQILLRPEDYSVIATLNLNGDYISDAAAAIVGGIGIAPGANLGDGLAIFEATHGTAPKHAGQNKVNPSSLILSAEMMLRHFGWNEAADLIINGMNATFGSRTVTYDFARIMDNANLVSCSDFGNQIIKTVN